MLEHGEDDRKIYLLLKFEFLRHFYALMKLLK